METIDKKTIVNILWTGGWDSTFRVLKLSEKNIIIQPYYLKDNRKSELHELNAIESISNDIKSNASTKCELRELITLKVSEVDEDNDITNAYKSLLAKSFFGIQYDWLGRFAKTIGSLELNIHQDDKAFSVIQSFGGIKKITDAKGEYYVIDNERSTEDIIKIFGRYHFPILNYTKLDMQKEAERDGFIDIMNKKTWFCHAPRLDQPCGMCNPCIYTIKEGLTHRFSANALRRYKRNKITTALKRSGVVQQLRRFWKSF